MKISELQPKQGKVDIELDVIEKDDVREFNKFGKPGRVCNAKAKDDSGEITLSLWNEDIDKVNAGDKIKITNGYVSEWQGNLQLSTGRFGTMEVIGSASGGASAPTPSESDAPKKPEPEEKPDIEEDFI